MQYGRSRPHQVDYYCRAVSTNNAVGTGSQSAELVFGSFIRFKNQAWMSVDF
jgi:hypothetical protein